MSQANILEEAKESINAYLKERGYRYHIICELSYLLIGAEDRRYENEFDYFKSISTALSAAMADSVIQNRFQELFPKLKIARYLFALSQFFQNIDSEEVAAELWRYQLDEFGEDILLRWPEVLPMLKNEYEAELNNLKGSKEHTRASLSAQEAA